MNGSPVNLGRQVQIGLWLITLQSEFCPQIPVHGLEHFWFIHASSYLHSELTIHSGLHAGGVPINVGKHEHIAWLLLDLHWLFGPQGVG